jgi:hypothetical protein
LPRSQPAPPAGVTPAGPPAERACHGPRVPRRPSRTAIRPGHPARTPHEKRGANLIYHFAEVGGYGLALEEPAGYLALAGTPTTGQDRNNMMALAATMQMDDNVRLTLAFCPRVL